MEDRDKKTELMVGLFLFVGLLLLGGLILKFGSVRELWRTTYELTVPFPDATGIKVGTPVVLGGSRIGKVPRAPQLNAQFNGVIIPLQIQSDKRIPIDAKFAIGTAGLLGDSYIEIRTSGAPSDTFIEPGASLTKDNVADIGGIGALQETANQIGKKADGVLDDLRGAAKEIKEGMTRVNNGALDDKTLESFRSSMLHFDSTMKNVDTKVLGEENQKKISDALTELKEAAAGFKNAAASVDTSAKRLGGLVEKLEPAIDKVDKAMTSADAALLSFKQSGDNLAIFTKDMAKGDGLMKALLLDKELREDFKDLIANLKHNGVLFYRDNAEKLEAEARARATQDQQRRR
jgi:phospholipid/cholesterol/gamma-HCH transport system substrate-binding protein